MEKRSSFGSKVRKRLSDITNSMPQPKTPARDEKLSPIVSSSKDQIDRLLQENMALVKIIADKNKIIELNGNEIQKHRANLQKMQLQNWNLARAHSQMLAEINLGKDKLLALRHELACKEALLKAKTFEFQNSKLKTIDEKKGSENEDKEVTKNHTKPSTSKGRGRPLKSRSMGPSTNSQQNEDNETGENKRRCVRRQSARFKSHEPEPKENLFEIDTTKVSSVGLIIDSPMHEDGPTLLDSSIKIDEKKYEKCDDEFEPKELKRNSFGRPMRRAAEKVQCYKEIPRNIKMRRNE